MSKAWDLTCVCDGSGPECLYCYKQRLSKKAPVPADSVRERFQREIDRVTKKAERRHQEETMSADWLDDDKPVPTPNATPKEPDGYHTAVIPKGEFGESSKILEEVLELQDAEKQGAKIMGLHELSDIVGAVHGYLEKHYPMMEFQDLVMMAALTRRAFKSGNRK